MLKQVHNELTKGWATLRETIKRVDQAEVKIAEREKRPIPRGRETPIYLERMFRFEPYDFEAHTLPLVMPAQRTTKIVRITAAVTFVTDITAATASYIAPSMRARPQGFLWTPGAGAGEADVTLFDFEWTFRVGSTDRRYTNGRDVRGWNARQSLGDVETKRQLLISERNPLRLGTNEFLTFSVRPILYNMDPDWSYETNARFVVHVLATGYRVFDV